MSEIPPAIADLERIAAAWEAVAGRARVTAAAAVEEAQAIAKAYGLTKKAANHEAAIIEAAGTLNVSQRTAETRIATALELTGQPAVVESILAGKLGYLHALVLLDELRTLPDAVFEKVLGEVLARDLNRPPAEIRRVARRVALRKDPDHARRRHQAAVADRRFTISPGQDGMAWLQLLVRAETALAIANRAEEANRAELGDGRSADQRRADWAADMLLGRAIPDLPAADEPSSPQVGLDRRRRRPTQVLVHVPVAVGLGLSDDPAELAEYGPIDADHARALLTGAELRKVSVDSITGEVLAVADVVVRPVADPGRVRSLGGGAEAYQHAQAEAVREAMIAMLRSGEPMPPAPEPGYRPSASLSRAVRLRSVRCDGVGCSQPARHCDIDHTIPWPAGETALANLKCRSRRCHRAKQDGWTPTPIPGGGTRWVSPFGRRYRVSGPHSPPPPIAVRELLAACAAAPNPLPDLPPPIGWVREPPPDDEGCNDAWVDAAWAGEDRAIGQYTDASSWAADNWNLQELADWLSPAQAPAPLPDPAADEPPPF